MKKLIAVVTLCLALGCGDSTPIPQAKRVWVMSENNYAFTIQEPDGTLEVYVFCDTPPIWKGLHADIVISFHGEKAYPCWTANSVHPIK